ncbi:flagellar hook assembly protein FlgD [Kiloniella laminariae]|uniref:Basal-body rod modification protein FlgD n=1 Tax=Kiloniella laminariae TaxID=454162 RepID=A0ABT4LHE7_9PROT|nr:flagellar hook capping FlgD N-terminal domain-containing protein [Kiloniella laminariae]MCZ4280520.1 flagellar hook assembly protein FlgD [Kiloniella laminariae]
MDTAVQGPAPVNGVTYKNTSDSGSLTGGTSLNSTFDMFLKLLTTQLKNQDPLNPTDNNEFVNQLTQFSQTEAALNTNTKLDSLIALQGNSQLSSALGYVGNVIKADSIVLNLDDSGADIAYALTGNSAKTEIKIIDATGKTVRVLNGSLTAGQHEIHWDGNDESGNPLEKGLYGFAVVATDSDDKVIQTAQGIKGTVTGVQMSNGTVVLNLGEVEIPLENVQAVLQKPASGSS